MFESLIKDLGLSVWDSVKESLKEIYEDLSAENKEWLKDIGLRIAEHAILSKLGPEDQRANEELAILALRKSIAIRVYSESMRLKQDKKDKMQTVLLNTLENVLRFAKHFVLPIP